MGADAGLLELMGPELRRGLPMLDERSRRLVLGMVAGAAGGGGIAAVAALTGASWQTVADGLAELESGDGPGPGRVRRPGGGRRAPGGGGPGPPGGPAAAGGGSPGPAAAAGRWPVPIRGCRTRWRR